MKLFFEALCFASIQHRDQRRKGPDGAPYVNHLIEVAQILVDHGIEDPDILSAAILHDVIEDTPITADELEARFGKKITSIVLEVTDDPELPIWEQKMAQITGAEELSYEAQQVRLGDKVSNLRGVLTSPPVNWSIERKVAYFNWAEQVVSGCTKALPGLLESFKVIYDAGLMTLNLDHERKLAKRRSSG